MDLEPFRAFARLHTEIAAGKLELEAKARKLLAMMDPLIDSLTDEGLLNLPIDVEGVGSITIHTHEQLWASAKQIGVDPKTNKPVRDTEALAAVLTANGLGDLVKPTVHSGSLSALVRESLATDGTPLPDAVIEACDIRTSHVIRIRKRS